MMQNLDKLVKELGMPVSKIEKGAKLANGLIQKTIKRGGELGDKKYEALLDFYRETVGKDFDAGEDSWITKTELELRQNFKNDDEKLISAVMSGSPISPEEENALLEDVLNGNQVKGETVLYNNIPSIAPDDSPGQKPPVFETQILDQGKPEFVNVVTDILTGHVKDAEGNVTFDPSIAGTKLTFPMLKKDAEEYNKLVEHHKENEIMWQKIQEDIKNSEIKTQSIKLTDTEVPAVINVGSPRIPEPGMIYGTQQLRLVNELLALHFPALKQVYDFCIEKDIEPQDLIDFYVQGTSKKKADKPDKAEKTSGGGSSYLEQRQKLKNGQ